MYKQQLFETGILYEILLSSKNEFNNSLKKYTNKTNPRITRQEKIKQLTDRLEEIKEQINLLNNKISNLNKEKDENEKLIEQDKENNNKKSYEVHTRWLDRVLTNLENVNKSLKKLQLEKDIIEKELFL